VKLTGEGAYGNLRPSIPGIINLQMQYLAMRLFLAINLRHEIKEELVDVLSTLKEFELDANFVQEEQVHITLLFLGEKSDPDKNRIQSALRKIHFQKFNLTVRGAGFFPNEHNPKVFWIGVQSPNQELVKLQGEICNALKVDSEKEFTGHITLARIRGNRNMDELMELKQELVHKVFGEFEVRRFDLVKSELTTKGPLYTILERFVLEGEGEGQNTIYKD
jgi:RNA 2',3'-cyclic 3'-phosphodiesterase